MPALNAFVQGFVGTVIAPPVCSGRSKRRAKERSSAAGVPGGSARYAVSEKTIRP